MGNTSRPSFDESFPIYFNHHQWIWIRNQLVPWELHASMAGLLAFDNRFTSLTFDWMIPWMFDFGSFSHSLDCTRVPWESLTSLVISLALVNDLPHWSVIKWFLPCSTSKHLFTWLDSYYIRIGTKTLGWDFTLLSAFPGYEGDILSILIYYHIDPLCIGLCLCFIIS
jgi:hypothetical protein